MRRSGHRLTSRTLHGKVGTSCTVHFDRVVLEVMHVGAPST